MSNTGNEYCPTREDLSRMTLDAVVRYFTSNGNCIADFDAGELLEIATDESGHPLLRRYNSNGKDAPYIAADTLAECLFSEGADNADKECVAVETPDGSLLCLTCLYRSYSPPGTAEYGRCFLDTAERYCAQDIDTYLNNLGDCVNHDSTVAINDGVLQSGDYLVFIDAPVAKWLYVYEQYLNSQSSCYKVRYYGKDDVPEELWTEAKEYEDYIDRKTNKATE